MDRLFNHKANFKALCLAYLYLMYEFEQICLFFFFFQQYIKNVYNKQMNLDRFKNDHCYTAKWMCINHRFRP